MKAINRRNVFLPRQHAPTLAFVFFFLVAICRDSIAAPGSIDPSFDPGLGIKAPGNGSLPVRVIFPLSDGSFLLGGFFTNYNGVRRGGLAKIFEDGALDETFVPDPIFDAINNEVFSISQQPDGQFIIGGIGGSPPTSRLVRLNPNGSLDPT